MTHPDSDYDTFDGDYEPIDSSGETVDEELSRLHAEWVEGLRQIRIKHGAETACRQCGCSQTRPCEGGCVWVEADLCSRCYRATAAMAKAWSAGGEA